MSLPIRHGGGEPKSVLVTDAGEILAEKDDKRSYMEIRTNNDAGDGPVGRVFLAISDQHTAVYLKGIFLDPGETYTIGLDNLTPARITAITKPGSSCLVFVQEGK
jgi:hypothetical protein